jgi:hypothetical protein
MPRLLGRRLRLRALEDPRFHRGRMLSGGVRGLPVHAGSDISRREVVLDAALLGRPRELARILIHEVLHFVWVRLGNPARRSYEDLLAGERAGGELGWSAELRKRALSAHDARRRTRRWREYACESFCDTGAWFFAGRPRHSEITLAARARERRRRWFDNLCGRGELRF